MNPKSLELRNLLGDGPEGVKCCSICGKPESRATKDVKALPKHAQAIAKDLPSRFRMWTKAVGPDKVLDFVTRARFNAELEDIRAKLTEAREEHDAYTPPEKDKGAGLKRTLVETLAMLGVVIPTDADGNYPDSITPSMLAEQVKGELSKLMALKADMEHDAMVEAQGS